MEELHKVLLEQIPVVTFLATFEKGRTDTDVSPQIDGPLRFIDSKF